MPISKLKDIYMAKSLSQLNKKAEETKAAIKVIDVLNCTKSALKLYSAAKIAVTDGDEERAYVLFYRFIDLYQQIRKSNNYVNHKQYVEQMIGATMVNEALSQSEQLSNSVEKRYEALSESERARRDDISNSQAINENQVSKSKKLESDSNDGEYPTITCISLLDVIENSSEITKILIIDTRSAQEYNESRILAKFKTSGDITVANIPNDLLIPGLTSNKLEKALPLGNSRDAFNRRRGMNKVIIVDKTSYEFIAGSPVCILADALWKWDQSAYKIKSKPLLLKGGYKEWLVTYPMYSTNANVLTKIDEFVAPKQFNLNFNYQFNDEEEEKENNKTENHVTVNGVLNGDINDEISNGMHERLHNIFNSPTINTPIPGIAKPIINRSLKPKAEIEETPKPIPKPSFDVEKFKLQKQMEATEEMVASLQTDMELKTREFELINKKKDDENDALRSALRKSKPSHLIHNDLSNSDKENNPPENAVNGELNQIKLRGRRNGIYLINNDGGDQLDDVEQNNAINNSEVKLNLNNSLEKPPKLASTPSNSVKVSGNSLSVNSSMSRSISSPNIAQLLAKEENENESDYNKLNLSSSAPKFDRTSKPSLSREMFNRESSTISDNKIRDFSPVYGIAGQSITGLRNLGNTCFMNSIVQCLLNTADFINFFNGKFSINRESKFGSKGELALEVAALLRTMAFPPQYKSIAPKDLKNCVSRHLPGFIGCDQQDSHEFLVMLLEKLHADLNQSDLDIIDTPIPEDLSPSVAANKFWKQHIAKNNSIVTRLFEGLLMHTLTCLYCSKVSNSFEVFSCLSLPLTNHRSSLNDCFNQFLKAEKITGEAGWECPTCKQKRDAEKKIAICKLPKVLLIHLKRFYYDGLWRQKLQTFIEFPIEDLSLRTFSAHESHYNLYGVVNHYGTLEGGHYIAFSKHLSRKKWYRYDDQEVTQMSAEDVKTQAAYVLFYIST